MTKRDDKRVPALRFKGFTDEWEQRKLKNLVDFYSGLTYHPENIREKGTFVIRSSNIKDGQLVTGDNIFVAPEIVNSTYVKKDDIIVVVRNGSRKLIGKHTKLNFNLNNAVIGAFMTGIRSNNNNFINAIFDSDNFKREIHKNLGATINQITTGELKRMNFYIPSLTSEQNYLGNLMKVLDKLITLQQRKLRLLKLLKKATQQNIFASTECLPKLKYRNLTGKWQLYRLKDVAKITMGQSPNSKNYTQNPIDHILVQGNADIRNGYVFPRIWTTEITKVANKGDIILCVRAPAGDVGRTKFNVVIGRGVAAIKGNDFIFQQLQFMKSSGYWKKYISGSTFESINSNDIKNAKIFCPSQLEQKNISSLLDDIDTSIQIQQKNILDFKYIKQFLLQNMFI